MDALALLCTLHADGPRTTRRLRHIGAHTLDGLRELPLAHLADALEASNAAAERFLREAEILLKRVRHEAVEVPAAAPGPEPPPPILEPAAVARLGAARPAGETARSSPAFGRPEGAAPPGEEDRDRERDIGPQDEGRAEPEPSAPQADEEGRGLPRYVLNPLVRGRSEPLRVTHVPEGGGGSRISLRPGLFEDLDAEACRRLAQGGVETVDDLATTSGLDLALDLNWPYDRVFHLKKEASFYLQEARSRASGRRADEEEEEGSGLGAEDEGAAGPFA